MSEGWTWSKIIGDSDERIMRVGNRKITVAGGKESYEYAIELLLKSDPLNWKAHRMVLTSEEYNTMLY